MTRKHVKKNPQESRNQPGRPPKPPSDKHATGPRIRSLYPGKVHYVDLVDPWGVSDDQVGRIFRGDVEPDGATARRIGEHRGKTLCWILTGEQCLEPDTPRAAEVSPAYAGLRFRCFAYAAADETRGAVTFDNLEREDDFLVPKDRTFITIHGDSMRDVAWDGQKVMLAGKGRSARSGDLIVADVKGHGCLFKRIFVEGEGPDATVVLVSANEAAPQPPITVPADFVRDMRVVVGVLYE